MKILSTTLLSLLLSGILLALLGASAQAMPLPNHGCGSRPMSNALSIPPRTTS